MSSVNRAGMTRRHDVVSWAEFMNVSSDVTNLLIEPIANPVTALATTGVAAPSLVAATGLIATLPIPTHWDRQNKLRLHILASNGADTGPVTLETDFTVLYKLLRTGDVVGNIAPTTAFSQVPQPKGISGVLTANSIFMFGPWVLPLDTIEDDQLFLTLRITPTADWSSDIRILNLLFEVTPKFDRGRIRESQPVDLVLA